MPCRDEGMDEYMDRLYGLTQSKEERLQIATKLACDYCKLLEISDKAVPEAKVLERRLSKKEALWWKEHQIADAKRKARGY